MENSSGTDSLNLVELSDKLAEVSRSCMFLFEAYDAIIRRAEEEDDAILLGGHGFVNDLKFRFQEVEDLLAEIRTQSTVVSGKS